MKIILSIKPQFANKIFEGVKRFEYRRVIFKSPDVKKVIVYASAPVSRVIGEFEIEKIIHKSIDSLWEETEEHSGITSQYFNEYFEGKELGFAIQIKTYTKYDESHCINKKYGVKAPQSFVYIN